MTAAVGALVLAGCVYSSPDPAALPDDGTATAVATPTAGADPTATPDELTLGGAPDPTATAEPDAGWLVVQDVVNAVNVRGGPGTDNPIVAEAPLGTTLAATGREETVGEVTWYEVELDGETTGWIHGRYLAPSAEPTPTPLSTPTPLATPTEEPAEQPSGDRLRVDAPAGLRLRDAPSRDAGVIRTIPDDSVVRATGASSDAEGVRWLEVRFRGDKGWVAAAFTRPA